MKTFLIAGVFFQLRKCSRWWGRLQEVVPGSGVFGGTLRDEYGESVVTEAELTEETLRFKKQYKGRADKISYRFRRESERTWVGHYEGIATGKDGARCVLSEAEEAATVEGAEQLLAGLDENFFQPPERPRASRD